MTKPAGKIRRTLRSVAQATAMIILVAACLIECVARAAVGKLGLEHQARVLSKWSIRIMHILGMQWTVIGRPPEHGLIVCNHLSYLDILVFIAAGCPAFVAKQEVRSWPGIGRVAAICGTIFIDRTRRSSTNAVRSQMEEALAAGRRMVLFPEGTSSDGSKVLPFHSSLFESAVNARAPITAAMIAYSISEGHPGTDVCYWGDMTMIPHLLKMLYKGTVTATLKFSSDSAQFTSRKEAAQTMQREVERLRESAGIAAASASQVAGKVTA